MSCWAHGEQTTAAPLPLRETYQLIPLLAKQISLDSPFKFKSLGEFETKFENGLV
jgi:hypothetical protein